MATNIVLLGSLRLTNEKKKILQQLELLIIDEISMVRCDTLDAIDTVLRHIRRSIMNVLVAYRFCLLAICFNCRR